MSLLFNTLSRFVIDFLPRSKHVLILWLQSLSTATLEPKKIKSVTAFTFSPSICHDVMGPYAMIFVFLLHFHTSWQIDGEKVETVADIIFLGSKITVDSDCSHKIKRCLLLGRKAKTNLDSTLKSRNITLLEKIHIVKAMVFPVVMYRCEKWTIKKTEHQRIDAFKLWCGEDSWESFGQQGDHISQS